jgi:uncharacterized membrane protein HdeD (DUF308 family)
MEEQRLRIQKPDHLSRAESAAWGGTFVLGALWFVAGVLCLGATAYASVAAVYYVGVLMAIAGLFGIVWGFRGAGGGALILGLLSLVVGVLLFIRPGVGLASITLLLIGYFFIAGLFRVVTSLMDRYENWGVDFAYGLCAIALGVIAARAWPVSAFWLLGMLVGVELLARGVSLMAAALSARRLMHGIHPRSTAS